MTECLGLVPRGFSRKILERYIREHGLGLLCGFSQEVNEGCMVDLVARPKPARHDYQVRARAVRECVIHRDVEYVLIA